MLISTGCDFFLARSSVFCGFRGRLVTAEDISSESQEQGGCDELVQHSGGEHASENHKREWVQDFLAGLSGPEQQRQQADKAGGRGHHHGSQSFQAALNDHPFAKLVSFVFHQVDVVRDHHDAVAADNSDEGDEADPVCDGQAGG